MGDDKYQSNTVPMPQPGGYIRVSSISGARPNILLFVFFALFIIIELNLLSLHVIEVKRLIPTKF